MDSLSPGLIVAGRYRIDAALGRGGMGAVWRATQLGLGRAVALKVLAPDLAIDEESRARFTREARVLAAFEHPGAVRVVDFSDSGGLLFLVMELVFGDTLSVVVREGRSSLEARVEVVAQVAETLAAAHERGIVHRDIKPDNILVDGEGRARLVDFGLAFAEGLGELDRMTAPDLVNGTPEYISPEQARALPLGPPTDVYSLGITLYEVITGQPPWTGGMGEVLAGHIYAAPPSVRAAEPAVPQALDELLQQMLAKEPADRPSAAAAADRMRAAFAAWERSGHAPDGQRVVSRDARAERAISPPSSDGAREPAHNPTFIVVVEGALDAAVALALAREGITVSERGDEAKARLLLDATAQAVRDAAGHGLLVVADVPFGDAAAAAEMLRAGAADVVARPVQAPEVAKKLRRALERAERRRRIVD